jgi:hypothetical protein
MIKKEFNEDDVRSIDNSGEIEDDVSNEPVSNDIIKIESKNETIPQLLNKSKSPQKPASDELRQSPNTGNIVVHLEDTSSPPIIESPNNSKYCSNCDISFTYSNTFIAHKQFYCKKKNNSTNNGTSPNGSNVNVSIAAETSV